MPIIFRCEHCNQKLSITSRKAGTMFKCPKCARKLMVPIPEAKLLVEDEPPPLTPESSLPPTREWNPGREKEQHQQEADDKAWAATREFLEKPKAELAKREPVPAPSPAPKRSAPKPPSSSEVVEEEFTLRGARSDQDEMDLTPMVDVTFLLLIFFMITASFNLTKTIETPAPDPENQGAQTLQNLEELEMTSIMVKIDAQDGIFVDDEPVDVTELEDVLGDKLRAEQKNELIIQSSPQSRHETFVNVFDAATGAGMQKIRLAATRGEE